LAVDPVDVGELGCVALYCGGVAADRGDGLVELRLAAAGDEDPRAFLGEALGGAEADAGAAARDDGDFAFELLTHDE